MPDQSWRGMMRRSQPILYPYSTEELDTFDEADYHDVFIEPDPWEPERLAFHDEQPRRRSYRWGDK